jgi:thymidylate synthase
MTPYLNALRQVLEQGQQRDDRTGVGTISLFGMQQRYNLAEEFKVSIANAHATIKRMASGKIPKRGVFANIVIQEVV